MPTTNTNPQIINLNKATVVGYCHHCQMSILDCDSAWVANQDEILCPYYGARRLVFCSKECLEKQTEFVLEKMKEARTKNPNPQE